MSFNGQRELAGISVGWLWNDRSWWMVDLYRDRTGFLASLGFSGKPNGLVLRLRGRRWSVTMTAGER